MRSRSRVPAPRPVHRLNGPGELLQAVPYLLGFHPTQSLVLVGLDGNAVTVTARLDLCDAAVPGMLAHTVAALSHGGSTSMIAAVYCEVADAAEAAEREAELPEALERAAHAAGCDVLDVLLVGEGRWWSLRCSSEQCCPAEGRPLPAAPSAFAAAATYSGVVALPDRAAVAAVLEPLPSGERERLDAAIAEEEEAAVRAVLGGAGERYERSVKRALFAAARESAEPAWAGPPDAQAARFGAARPRGARCRPLRPPSPLRRPIPASLRCPIARQSLRSSSRCRPANASASMRRSPRRKKPRCVPC